MITVAQTVQPESEHKDGKIERRSMKSGLLDNRPFHRISEKCAGKFTFREKVNVGKTQYSCGFPMHQKVRSRKTLISWAFLCSDLSCTVCAASINANLSKLSASATVAQTVQLKFLHMFSNKVTSKPNSQVATLTALWRFERRQNESGHPLDLRNGVAFERVKNCQQVPQSGQQRRLSELLVSFNQSSTQANQQLTRRFGPRAFGARQAPDHQASRSRYQQSPCDRFGRRLLPLFNLMAGALEQLKVGLNLPAPKIPLRNGLRRHDQNIRPEQPARKHFAVLVAQLADYQTQIQRLAFDTLIDVLAILDLMSPRRAMQNDFGRPHVLMGLFTLKLDLALEFKIERRANLRHLHFMPLPFHAADFITAYDKSLFLAVPSPEVADRIRLSVNDVDQRFAQLLIGEVAHRQSDFVQMLARRQGGFLTRAQDSRLGAQPLIERRQWIASPIAQGDHRIQFVTDRMLGPDRHTILLALVSGVSHHRPVMDGQQILIALALARLARSDQRRLNQLRQAHTRIVVEAPSALRCSKRPSRLRQGSQACCQFIFICEMLGHEFFKSPLQARLDVR